MLPEAQGHGVGRRLLLDGLHWLRGQRAGEIAVNTQLGNDAALALYRRVGFRDDPAGLSVLSTALTVAPGGLRPCGPGLLARPLRACCWQAARGVVLFSGEAAAIASNAHSSARCAACARRAPAPRPNISRGPDALQLLEPELPGWGRDQGSFRWTSESRPNYPAGEELEVVVYGRLTARSQFQAALGGDVPGPSFYDEHGPAQQAGKRPPRRARREHSRVTSPRGRMPTARCLYRPRACTRSRRT